MVVILMRALTWARDQVIGNAHAFRTTSQATRNVVVCMMVSMPSTVPLAGWKSPLGF